MKKMRKKESVLTKEQQDKHYKDQLQTFTRGG